eukprot:GEMP01036029.1.p1 GENE.GEMP01036029.1~~GEMP01036029.1.p1  ORF type:complete len:421 (+),score=56.15 GEMP01036029.1:297-1559(+)
MVTLAFFAFFLVGDAAQADIPLSCHILGGLDEFPVGREEMEKWKRSIVQTPMLYRNVADLPSATLAIARETIFHEPRFIAETATGKHTVQLIDLFKEHYFNNEVQFPTEIENGKLQQVKLQVTIDGRSYVLQEFLGSGQTADVYRAVELGDVQFKPYAVKLGKKQTRPRMPPNVQNLQILNEFYAMQLLSDHAQVPHVYAIAQIRGNTERCIVMVSDFIGRDLSSLARSMPEGVLSLEDTLHYGIKLVSALRQLHSQFRLLHRDIKPANILIKDAGTGFAKDNELFLTDFGAAITYITLDGRHIRFETDADFVGTTRYMSLRAFNRRTSGRQDDMFSALLSLMRLEGSYGSRQHALRARDMTNFDNTWLQNADSNTIPNPFLMFWRATHNTMLGDGPHWQKRPQYETVISAFQEELNRIG